MRSRSAARWNSSTRSWNFTSSPIVIVGFVNHAVDDSYQLVRRERSDRLFDRRFERPAIRRLEGAGAGIAAAMMMNIQVRHAPALYIELIMLGLPTLVFANGLIDKMKKAQD